MDEEGIVGGAVVSGIFFDRHLMKTRIIETILMPDDLPRRGHRHKPRINAPFPGLVFRLVGHGVSLYFRLGCCSILRHQS